MRRHGNAIVLSYTGMDQNCGIGNYGGINSYTVALVSSLRLLSGAVI